MNLAYICDGFHGSQTNKNTAIICNHGKTSKLIVSKLGHLLELFRGAKEKVEERNTTASFWSKMMRKCIGARMGFAKEQRRWQIFLLKPSPPNAEATSPRKLQSLLASAAPFPAPWRDGQPCGRFSLHPGRSHGSPEHSGRSGWVGPGKKPPRLPS